MDSNEEGRKGPGHTRRLLVSAGLVGSGLLAGGIIAGTQIAGAQTATPTATASSTPSGDARTGTDVGHGPNETLLTGTTADKVKAAALAAVPGGTIIRVETDSDGSPYEAHVQKSDGTVVTVKVDKNFDVTDTVSGFGSGPHDQQSSDGTGA
jgi:hypothetical protein